MDLIILLETKAKTRALSGASINIIFNANRGYSVESLSKITFDKNAGKKLFAKAGRSKPQGDLILYFGEKSCLARGRQWHGEPRHLNYKMRHH